MLALRIAAEVYRFPCLLCFAYGSQKIAALKHDLAHALTAIVSDAADLSIREHDDVADVVAVNSAQQIDVWPLHMPARIVASPTHNSPIGSMLSYAARARSTAWAAP
jgi:hypothetical protein